MYPSKTFLLLVSVLAFCERLSQDYNPNREIQV